MSEPQPIRFSVSEAGSDLTLLPEAGRQRGSQAFQEAVTAYYKDAYREAAGRVDVGFCEGQIEVNWEPQSGQVPASATIATHLEAGRYDEAIPLLRTRLQLEPDHMECLYNLGMVCSDRMQLPEAQELLGRAVQLEPGDANAQVALGIAALRDNDPEAAPWSFPSRNTTPSTTAAAPPSRVCRPLATSMWVCSSCCLGRMRALIWRGSTRWPGGWLGLIRSWDLGIQGL